jgi:hypothetical protein
MKYSTMSILSVILLFNVHCWQVSAQASGDTCQGTVGINAYNLAGLRAATGGTYQSALDMSGNTYYYRPCLPIEWSQCFSSSDLAPAVCQKDSSPNPRWLDCGSNNQPQWSARATGADTGFIITFGGGEMRRQTSIEFICDPATDTGKLEAAIPTENPMLWYHLKWSTKYACPQALSPSPSPSSTSSPTPSPPYVQCCHYEDVQGTQENVCIQLDGTCAVDIPPNFQLKGTSRVSSCNQCTGSSSNGGDGGPSAGIIAGVTISAVVCVCIICAVGALGFYNLYWVKRHQYETVLG